MKIWPLPLLLGALPIVAVGLSLQLSQSEGLIPDCNPFFAGCTTVSATGRGGTAYFLFKALMLPCAGLLAVFWTVAFTWLRHRKSRLTGGWILLLLGLLSAAMLALYTSYLGSEGAAFRTYRRLGASSFLAGTFFCQLLFVTSLGWTSHTVRLMVGLVATQLLLGLASLPFTTLADPVLKDIAENVIEWWFGLALMLFFPLCAWLWRNERLDWSTPEGR